MPACTARAAWAAGPVRPGRPASPVSDAVDGARDGDEPRAHRDLEAAQTARMPGAVEALVGGPDDRRRGSQPRHRRQQLEDDVGVTQRQPAIEPGERLSRLPQRLRQQRESELMQGRRLADHMTGRGVHADRRRQFERDHARAGGVPGGAGQATLEEGREGRRQTRFGARLAVAGVPHQRRLGEHRALELAIAGTIVGRRVAPFEGTVHRAHDRAARQRRFDLFHRAAAPAEPARRLAAGPHHDHRQIGVARLEGVRQMGRRPGVDRAGHDGDVGFLFLRQRQRLVGRADRQALEAGALDPARDGVLEPGVRFDDEDLVGSKGTHGNRSENRRDLSAAAMTFVRLAAGLRRGSDAVDDERRVERRRGDGEARGRAGLHGGDAERERPDRGVERREVGHPGADRIGQDRHQRRPTRPVETPRRLGQLDEPAVARAGR